MSKEDVGSLVAFGLLVGALVFGPTLWKWPANALGWLSSKWRRRKGSV